MINGEQKELMRTLREQGLSYYEIAQRLNTTQDSVRNFFYRERQKESLTTDVVGTLIKQVGTLKRKLHKQQIQREIDKEFANRIIVPKYKQDIKVDLEVAREEAVLMLSDIHYGMLHQGASNVYNPEIAEERLNYIIGTTIELLHKYYPYVHKLNIFLLGDMVEGYGIFKGQEYSSIPLTSQISEFPAILANALSQVDLEMEIFAVRGNHGRIEKGVPQHNWDNVIYELLSRMINVKMTIAEDFFLPVTIKNTKFILLHGDGITNSKVPQSGIERAVGEFTRMFKDMGIYFDWLAMGHFHQQQKLSHALMNGSLCGDTLLSTHKIHASETPQQMFFLVDERYGLTDTRDIKWRENEKI